MSTIRPLEAYETLRHVGYTSTAIYKDWMSRETLDRLCSEIHALVRDRYPGWDIQITERSVWAAMDTIYKRYSPLRGDPTSVFTINYGVDEVKLLDDRVKSLVLDGIDTDVFDRTKQQELSIWDTLLGDFNRHQITQTGPIKVRRNRRPFVIMNDRY